MGTYVKRFRLMERVGFQSVHGYGFYSKREAIAEAKRVHKQAGNKVEVHIARADARWDIVWSSDHPAIVGQ
jgi:hypothetical protein